MYVFSVTNYGKVSFDLCDPLSSNTNVLNLKTTPDIYRFTVD